MMAAAGWKLAKGMDYNLGLGRSDGRCTAPGCAAKATDVVKHTTGAMAAYCRPCRLGIVGETTKERAAMKGRQGTLL
jgi:hypothetical protein